MEHGGPGAPHSSGDRADGSAIGSLSSRATSGAALLVLRGLATRVAGAGGTLVLARLLVPHQFGELAFGLTLIALASFLVDSGVGASLIRGDREPDPQMLRAVVGFQCAAAAILIGVLAALAVPFGAVMLLTATMTLDLLFASCRVPANIVMERQLRYRPLATAEVCDALAFNTLAICLVVLGMGVWGVAIAGAVQAIPGTLYILYTTPAARIRPSVDLPTLRPIIAFGAQFQAIALVELIRDEVAAIAVGAFVGFGTLGIITLADQLLQVVSLLFESLWRVSFPAMAELRREGGDANAAVMRISRLCLLVTAVLVCGAAGAVPGSLTIIFGARWDRVLQILPGMLAGLLVVGPVSVACAGFLLAADKAGTVLRSAIAHTAATWAALPFLLAFGLRALSVGAFIVCLVEAVILAQATGRLTGRNPLIALLPTLCIALAISGGAWWLAVDIPRGLLGSAAIAAAAIVVIVGWYACFERATLVDIRNLASRYTARFRVARSTVLEEDVPVL